MLDLNHPQTEYIFAISGRDGAILSLIKKMTLSNSQERLKLLSEVHTHIAAMHSILDSGWNKKRNEKREAIEKLHNCVRELANTHSDNDFIENGVGQICTVCGNEIEDLEGYSDMVYCRTCIRVTDQGRKAVEIAFNLYAI